MNLEQLKKSWETVGNRVHAAEAFNKKLMENIYSSKANSTVESIRKVYTSFYFVLTVEVIFLIGVLAGNPFDFQHWGQLIPFALLLIGVLVALANLVQLHYRLNHVSSDGSIADYLRGIISIYDRNKRFEKTFAIVLLTVGLMVPFSFMSKKVFAGTSVLSALMDTAIPLIVSVVMFLAAQKLGLFRNRHKEKLARHLQEWEELRTLANNITVDENTRTRTA